MKPKAILIVLSIIAVIVVVGVGSTFLLYEKFTRAMYPPAPPMPPVVSQSMDEILAQLEDELKAKAPEVLTNLQPGLSMDKIDELEKQSGVQIPDDLKAVYHWRNGYSRAALELSKFQASGPMPGHYFVPLDEALEMSRGLSNQVAGTTPVQRTAFNALVEFTKTWITLFDDGSGDGYFYDPKREPVEGAIFYHDMEDTGYTFFPSPKNLFAGMVKCYQQNIFVRKEGTNGASLDEDFEAAEKIWKEFGVESAQN